MKPPSENEIFLKFVQLLRDDAEMGAMIRQLLKADPKNRAMFLTLLAARMRQDGQPEQLAQVLEWLREPKILKKVVELLDSDPE